MSQTDAERLASFKERFYGQSNWTSSLAQWLPTDVAAEVDWLLAIVKRQRTLLDKCVALLTPLAYYLDSLPAGRANAVEIRGLVEEVRR